MTPAGWTIMIASVSSVILLTVFCLYKVFTLPPVEAVEHLKAPIDIDTGDTQDAD